MNASTKTATTTTTYAQEWKPLTPAERNVQAVAHWVGESGSTYVWPQATTDNRPSRVLARIRRFGMEEPEPGTLVIVHFAQQ